MFEGDETEAQLTVRVDLGTVEAKRAKIPIIADRRPELYWGCSINVNWGLTKVEKRETAGICPNIPPLYYFPGFSLF